MAKIIAIGQSIFEAMWLGFWLIGTILFLMTITGFITWTI